MNLHSTLTKVVPDINNTLDHINHGGCGWFAHTLHTILAAKSIQSDIVLVCWAYYDTPDVKHMLDHLEVDDINEAYRILFSGHYSGYCNPCFGHVGVRVNGVIYDCDGVLNKPAISEPIDVAVMDMALAMPSGTWNPEFIDSNSGTGGGAVYKMKEFLTQALSGVSA